MSKKFAPKFILIQLCIFAWISLLFHSCKKDLLLPQAPSQTLLARTKLFYNQQLLSLELKARQLQGTSVQNNTTRPRKKPSPIWEQALVEKTSDGKTMVTVPFAKFKIDSKSLDYTRKFTFSESNGEIVDGQIVEVYGSPEVIANRGAELIGQTGGQDVAGFTGAILSYSLDYKYKQGKYYQDGHARKGSIYIDAKLPDTAAQRLQATVSSGQKPISSNKILSLKPSNIIASTRPVMEDGQNCEHYYWVYIEKDNWGNVVYIEVLGYAYSVCTPTQDPIEPGGYVDYYIDCAGVRDGSAYNSDCGCIGGTTGRTECPRDTTNHVTNPCINAGLLKALGKNVKSQIKSLMTSTFLANSEINLEFSSSPFPASGSSANADAITTQWNLSNPLSQQIAFNENILPNKSEEYIVATVYHEVLHAYFANLFSIDQQGKFIVPQDHEYMASNYINMLSRDLMNLYPNLSETEAWALSWGGLERTNLYTLLNVNQKGTIYSINTQFSTKPNPANPSLISKGTYCP